MSVILYDYWRSSAAYRLRIALGLAGIEFESRSVDLLSAGHKTPEHLARNPQGLVPVLDFHGQIMTQSLAIIEFLDEAGHGQFLPRDFLGRAYVRRLSYAIAMEIHPVCNLSVAKYATDHSGGNLGMKDWMQVFIPKGLAAFEAMLTQSRTYCFQDQISMADICLVPQIYNAGRWGINFDPYPKINRVVAQLLQNEAVAAAHPDRFQPKG